ncbi:rubredoxin (plasmid) [Azospirillum sp. B510]|uniref:rubredoxin n=1 Tax=Azospirillum sp. (strain B510) TaxID=137722 RepID=UPI0001C4CB1F|nr:rubredoxin [Azospirillum sp. B510]BAI74814.1 rubredoxin [Azospirillum sp. B510]
MKSWMCVNCGYVYVEAAGDPAGGIPPGTRWEDVPDDWICPDCGLGKGEFEMMELD